MEHIILEILCVLRNSHDRIFINTHNLSVTYHSFLRLFYIHTINHTYRSHIGIHISLASVYKINIVRLSYYITFTRYYVVFVRTFDVQTATFKLRQTTRHSPDLSSSKDKERERGKEREVFESTIPGTFSRILKSSASRELFLNEDLEVAGASRIRN